MARVGIQFESKDGVSPTVKSINSSINKLTMDTKNSILAGVGLGAGITAFGLLERGIRMGVDALGDMVQSAVKDEESVSRLTAALHANVAGWDGNLDAINKNIKAGQALGFTDDDLRESLAFLTAATHDISKAQEIQATAMDLARFKHIDLRTATEALVKVEAGRYRILASLGIQLKAGATQTEALAAVQAIAAGQAEAFGDTTAGAMEEAQIAIEEAGESIGRSLTPFVLEAAHWIRDDLAPAIDGVAAGLADLGDGIRQFAIDVHNLTGIGDSPAAWLDTEQTNQFLDNLSNLVDESGRILTTGSDQIRTGARQFITPMYDEVAAAKRKAIDAVKALPGDLAEALTKGEDDVRTGMEDLTTAMEEELSDAAQIAYLKGVLASDELARGLTDERASVRGAAFQVQADALAQLKLLESGAADAAVNAGTTFAEQFRLQRVAAGNAAADVKRAVQGNLAFGDQADDWGRNSIQAWITGMRSMWGTAHAAAIYLGTAVSGPLKGYSPPKEGPLKDIDKWGENIGQAWAEGLGKGSGAINLSALLGMSGSSGGGLATAAVATGGYPALPNIVVMIDGREASASTARWDYYTQPKTALLPKG